MRIPIVRDGWVFILGAPLCLAAVGGLSHAMGWVGMANGCWVATVVVFTMMAFFFRDPSRQISPDPSCFVSGADGRVQAVQVLQEDQFLKVEAVRISVFLSVFNVHVNRSPMAGRIVELGYTPGRKLFAFLNIASEYNEHSSILIHGDQTRCLVKQIVGPVARRVVYWLKEGQVVERGERIGLMKFGSRLDVYFPRTDVEVSVKKGDKVVAGVTVLATLKRGAEA